MTVGIGIRARIKTHVVERCFYLGGADPAVEAGDSDPLVLAQNLQSIALTANYGVDFEDLCEWHWEAANNYGETDGEEDATWEDVTAIVNVDKTHYVFKRHRNDGGEKVVKDQFGLRLRVVTTGATYKLFDYSVEFDYGGYAGGPS